MHHSRHHHHHTASSESMEGRLGQFFLYMGQLPYPLLLLTLIFMPLFYNNGQPWWLPLLGFIATTILMLYSLTFWWHGRMLPQPRFSPALLLFLIPLAVSLIQLVPDLPGLEAIAPNIAQTWHDFNDNAVLPASPTLTLAPDATTERALIFAICGVLCFLLTTCTDTSNRLKGLLLAIIGAALGNAIMAYAELGSAAVDSQRAISGAFLNSNHFAFLMMIGTITALGLLTIVAKPPHHTDLKINRHLWEKMALPMVLVIFILLTSQVMCLSRGAFLASVLAIVLFALLWIASPNELQHRKKQMIFAYGVILSLALAFALFFSLEKLSDRYKVLSQREFTMDARWLIWEDAVKLIRENWQTGVGQGAFPHVIQAYESGHFTSSLLAHAHNDFLEFIAETGVPIAAILIVLSLAFMAIAFRRAWKDSSSRTRKWAACGSLVAIIGALIHESFDFNLQAWANMLVFTALIAATAIAVRKTEDHSHEQELSLTSHRRKRVTTRLPWLIVALAALAALPMELKLIQAGIARANLMEDMEQGLTTQKPGNMDFKRRLKLIDAARHPLLSQHYISKQQAIVYATRAEQDYIQAPELIQQAARNIAEAARRLPTDGDTAFLNATFQRHAMTLECGNVSRQQLEKLYDWAIGCQPNLEPILESIGMIAFQNFMDADAQDDQKTSEHEQSRARKILLKCLDLDPDNLKIYDALFYLFGNIPELLTATPDNYEAMATLAKLLLQKKQFQDALNLTEHILKRKTTLELTNEQVIETLSVKAAAQELLGLLQQRSQTCNELWKAVDQPAMETHDNAKQLDAKQLLDYLEKESSKRFLSTDEIIKKAQASSIRGRKNDVVITLLQLIYRFSVQPTLAQTDQALKILGDPKSVSNPFFLTRAVFLHHALTVLCAEKTKMTQRLPQTIAALEQLLKTQDTLQSPWLNQHLIPIFIARAQRLLGDNEQASKQLRASLDLCPANIIALNLLQQTDPQQLTPDERQLMQTIGERDYPIAFFNSGLAWFATSASKPEITAKHDEQTVTYLFVCYNDILQPIKLNMDYYDHEGLAFHDPVVFKKGQEFTFRIGEIVAVNHTWQPFVKTLEQARRILHNGKVVVKAKAKALPMPITTTFDVNLKTTPEGDRALRDGTQVTPTEP